MKTCNKCGKTLPLDGFAKNRARADGLQSWCRECGKVRAREYYKKNKSRMQPQIKAAAERRRDAIRQKVHEYLLRHPCVDCGEADPIVLDFDHVRGVKSGSVANLKRNVSVDVVFAEITKCEVRCANCHRRKTAKDFFHPKLSGEAPAC